MAIDGINRLIQVTQLKSSNANDQAMLGAHNQRGLVSRQKSLRSVERTFAELTRSEQQSAVLELQTKLPAFLRTLSLPAAALLNQWLEWAAQHR